MDLVTLLLGLIKILAGILFVASIIWLISRLYRQETQYTEDWKNFAKYIDEKTDVLDEVNRKWINDHRYKK